MVNFISHLHRRILSSIFFQVYGMSCCMNNINFLGGANCSSQRSLDPIEASRLILGDEEGTLIGVFFEINLCFFKFN